MIIVDCVQGTPEWHRARLGVLTASRVSQIFTATGKLSSQRTKLLHLLLAEWALQQQVDDFGGTYWTERGSELEAEASAYFALATDLEPTAVGFCYRDESRTVGCSPDWLIHDKDGEVVAGAETKCPRADTHIGYLLCGQVPTAYVHQVQFSLWVTGLELWYFQSYYPGLPPVLKAVEPDKDLQALYSAHVPEFLRELSLAKSELEQLGIK
jgi:hypothetical protein